MNAWNILLGCLWALCAAGLAWYCASVAREITYVTLADGRRQERRLPLIFRLVLPLASNVTPLFGKPAFARIKENTTRKLTAAGFDELLTNEEFLSLSILLPVILGPFWLLLMKALSSSSAGSFLEKIAVLLYLSGPLGLYIYPAFWLKSALAARHGSIQRAIPFVLDLLTLSVEAGMDFMTALQRNVERRAIDPLNEELLRVVREIQVGKTRREALRDMAARTDLSEIRSVVNALVQADELGVSIGSILRIQSDQVRQKRFERAEKLANEAPVKMLFPLMVFIFPAVFLVLLGPVITRLVQQGF